MRVFKTRPFARWARNEGISDRVLREAVAEIEAGLVDADLGGGVFKKRVPRPGGGKRGGYRVLLVFRRGHHLVFVVGFAKSSQDNISKPDLEGLRELTVEVLMYDDDDLDAAVEAHKLIEIDHAQKYDS
jgi:hypothetical protein